MEEDEIARIRESVGVLLFLTAPQGHLAESHPGHAIDTPSIHDSVIQRFEAMTHKHYESQLKENPNSYDFLYEKDNSLSVLLYDDNDCSGALRIQCAGPTDKGNAALNFLQETATQALTLDQEKLGLTEDQVTLGHEDSILPRIETIDGKETLVYLPETIEKLGELEGISLPPDLCEMALHETQESSAQHGLPTAVEQTTRKI